MRRAVAGLVTALAVAVGSAGCASGTLTKRELVVHFTQSATEQQHRAVLVACAHAAPNVTPEPIMTSRYRSDEVGDVRFRIDHASDNNLAKLLVCLNKQHGVVGIDIPD